MKFLEFIRELTLITNLRVFFCNLIHKLQFIENATEFLVSNQYIIIPSVIYHHTLMFVVVYMMTINNSIYTH